MTVSHTRERIDGRTARWEGQRQRRRDEFVEAALVAIAEHGADVSTQQIAERAGVARTRLYKYFSDAGDLQRAVAERAIQQMIETLEPVWSPQGSPMDMITAGAGAYVGWLATHQELFRYLSRHSLLDGSDNAYTLVDLQTAVGHHLTVLFADYLSAADIDTRAAELLAFGVAGFVYTATLRWLSTPGGLSQDELIAKLARWIWSMIDESLQGYGIHLDPHAPLDLPAG
ncbi:TetR/AcrR family transcriptional regulator [Streptomyces sp. NPDC047081]|uniref:TetR/AcrR family transcriptional regulator n=1 Tax=Streptomyces sp. NPDC047081 TaxID=3154706 RepID=UPI0033D227F3